MFGLFLVTRLSSSFEFLLNDMFFLFFSATFLPFDVSVGVCSTHVNVLLVERLLRLSGNSFGSERILRLVG